MRNLTILLDLISCPVAKCQLLIKLMKSRCKNEVMLRIKTWSRADKEQQETQTERNGGGAERRRAPALSVTLARRPVKPKHQHQLHSYTLASKQQDENRQERESMKPRDRRDVWKRIQRWEWSLKAFSHRAVSQMMKESKQRPSGGWNLTLGCSCVSSRLCIVTVIVA